MVNKYRSLSVAVVIAIFCAVFPSPISIVAGDGFGEVDGAGGWLGEVDGAAAELSADGLGAGEGDWAPRAVTQRNVQKRNGGSDLMRDILS